MPPHYPVENGNGQVGEVGEIMIQLGAKLANPYSVSNMPTAHSNITTNENPYISYADITITHYYMRYLPADESELDILKEDPSLTLFDHPLDYVIVENVGTAYHDPSLALSQITWQYCVVEKDYDIIGTMQYEILADLFIPELLLEKNNISDTAIENEVYDLVYEVLRITNFIGVSTRLRESWANVVEWFITSIEYNSLGVSNYADPTNTSGPGGLDHMQKWTSTSSLQDYTPMFVDFVDSYNQDAYVTSNSCPYGGGFNSAHCWLGDAPIGSGGAFEYANKFYCQPVGTNGCPLSGSYYDGANCFVQAKPPGGVVYNNGWYYTSTPGFDYYGVYPNDDITGYTMAGIESSWLKDVYALRSLKTQLKANKPSGMTDAKIDTYLNYY